MFSPPAAKVMCRAERDVKVTIKKLTAPASAVRRAEADAESALATRSCIYILRAVANADRKTNFKKMKKTSRDKGFPGVSLRALGVPVCGRFSTLNAFRYVRTSNRAISFNGQIIIHPFVFRSALKSARRPLDPTRASSSCQAGGGRCRIRACDPKLYLHTASGRKRG